MPDLTTLIANVQTLQDDVTIIVERYDDVLAATEGVVVDVSSEIARAQQWAAHPEDTLIPAPEGNGVDDYSSLHHARKAEASAAQAANLVSTISPSVTNALAAQAAAEAAQTAAEAAETAAEVARAAAQTAATNAGTSETNAAASASAAAGSATAGSDDATQTAADRAAVATDRSESATNAATALTHATTAQNAASSVTAAATLAEQWASEAQGTVVDSGRYSALHYSLEAEAASTAAAASLASVVAARDAAQAAETAAGTSETNAAASAATASTNAGNAAAAQTAAETAQSGAEAAQVGAVAAQGAAVVAQTASEAAWASFNAVYLGAFGTAPTTDNDGGALAIGMLYFHTGSTTMYVWDGVAWDAAYASQGSPFTLDQVTGQGATTTNEITVGGVNSTGAVTGTNLNVSDWDTAFSWGDHGSAGYALAAALNAANWDAAFGWGDHANAGYAVAAALNAANWDAAFGWGDHASAGYLTSELWALAGTDVTHTATDSPGLQLFDDGTNGWTARFGIDGTTGAVEIEVGGTVRQSIAANGDTAVTGALTVSGNITAFSDERIKENIRTADGDKVLAMRGVNFTRKSGEEDSGVIAQELREVAPELVFELVPDTLSVNYAGLSAYFIEQLKSQAQRLNALEAAVGSS